MSNCTLCGKPFKRHSNGRIKPCLCVDEKNLSLPDQCLVHRYRYYVMAAPTITDREYDMLERDAIRLVDSWCEDTAAHPIFKPGSDRAEDYPQHIIDIATS